mmetsp:Transcript_171169/g.548674  ORF Transcript_171169/g.548674 Transcript_171169/m.548674 type:complete len:234 (-) Transcript_171169:876-1577(-)
MGMLPATGATAEEQPGCRQPPRHRRTRSAPHPARRTPPATGPRTRSPQRSLWPRRLPHPGGRFRPTPSRRRAAAAARPSAPILAWPSGPDTTAASPRTGPSHPSPKTPAPPVCRSVPRCRLARRPSPDRCATGSAPLAPAPPPPPTPLPRRQSRLRRRRRRCRRRSAQAPEERCRNPWAREAARPAAAAARPAPQARRPRGPKARGGRCHKADRIQRHTTRPALRRGTSRRIP